MAMLKVIVALLMLVPNEKSNIVGSFRTQYRSINFAPRAATDALTGPSSFVLTTVMARVINQIVTSSVMK